MVKHDRQTQPPGELIPGLNTLPKQQPGAEELAIWGRSVAMPIVDTPTQAASDEEPLGQREQRPPGTAAPGQPDIPIVGRTRRVDRETNVQAWCPEDAEEGRRGEQDLDVE